MQIGVRSIPASAKIRTAILSGLIAIAMLIPGRDVAHGQIGIGTNLTLSVTFDMPFQGTLQTFAHGINNRSQIVGSFVVGSTLHSFLKQELLAAVMDVQYAAYTEAFGINDYETVGWFTDTGGVNHGYTMFGGGFTSQFDAPGIDTRAYGVNGRGDIVGEFIDSSNTWHSYLRDAGGVFTTIDCPDSFRTVAHGINDTGLVVGIVRYAANPVAHGFLRSPGGSCALIDVPFMLFGGALGINNVGQIVGETYDGNGMSHGFLRNLDGTLTIFDVPNSRGTHPYGINDRGQIVGWFTDLNYNPHAFMGTIQTVPEWYQAGVPNPPGCSRDATGNPIGCPQGWVPYPNNFWGSAQLDSTSPFLSITKAGCALTALTIVTNYWLLKRSTPSASNPQPLGSLTPLDINAWENPGVFVPGASGDVSWKPNILSKAGIGLARSFPNYNNASLYNGFPIINSDNMQTFDNILRNGVPVILRIVSSPTLGYPNGKTLHFVVVKGKTPNGDYYLNDPGWYPSLTLYNLFQTGWWQVHRSSGETPCIICSLSNPNNFLVYTNIKITQADPITLKGLGVYSTDPVDFILTDSQGNQTGFDPVSQTSFHSIPVSDYSATIYRDEQDASSPSPPPLKALVLANQLDGLYTLKVIGTASGNFTVYVIASDEAGNDILQSYAGTTAPGVSSQFAFQGTVVSFSAFGVNNLAISPTYQAFGMDGTFTPGLGGIISPLTQPVTIQIGNAFVATIPAGSFQQTPQGTFAFGGVIQGVLLAATLIPTGGNGYAFAVAGAGAPNLPSSNPVTVQLAIGNNGGSTSLNAIFVP